jgi:small-conductance mechanosensitive channel
VLQTAFNDFNVTYQVNAYTNKPNKMAAVYSGLYQNIQDEFHKAGIELVSPQYITVNKNNIP